MRRQQQLNEELRKQLISLNARLEAEGRAHREAQAAPFRRKNSARKPAPSRAPPHPTPAPPRPRPFDQKFLWKADGRSVIQVSPRDIQRAVDRNDEEFVFSLIQALDALRETNERGYKMLLERIRQVDRYYARVLTADTTRVLVDASNVARYEKDKAGRGQLRNLLTMRDELRRRDCFPILLYADASLPHNIDEPARATANEKSRGPHHDPVRPGSRRGVSPRSAPHRRLCRHQRPRLPPQGHPQLRTPAHRVPYRERLFNGRRFLVFNWNRKDAKAQRTTFER